MTPLMPHPDTLTCTDTLTHTQTHSQACTHTRVTQTSTYLPTLTQHAPPCCLFHESCLPCVWLPPLTHHVHDTSLQQTGPETDWAPRWHCEYSSHCLIGIPVTYLLQHLHWKYKLIKKALSLSSLDLALKFHHWSQGKTQRDGVSGYIIPCPSQLYFTHITVTANGHNTIHNNIANTHSTTHKDSRVHLPLSIFTKRLTT